MPQGFSACLQPTIFTHPPIHPSIHLPTYAATHTHPSDKSGALDIGLSSTSNFFHCRLCCWVDFARRAALTTSLFVLSCLDFTHLNHFALDVDSRPSLPKSCELTSLNHD